MKVLLVKNDTHLYENLFPYIDDLALSDSLESWSRYTVEYLSGDPGDPQSVIVFCVKKIKRCVPAAESSAKRLEI